MYLHNSNHNNYILISMGFIFSIILFILCRFFNILEKKKENKKKKKTYSNLKNINFLFAFFFYTLSCIALGKII